MSQDKGLKHLPQVTTSQKEENARAEAMARLMREDQKGLESAEKYGWISEEEAYRLVNGSD